MLAIPLGRTTTETAATEMQNITNHKPSLLIDLRKDMVTKLLTDVRMEVKLLEATTR